MTWELPRSLPDLSRYDHVALDLETCDPDLKEKGPSVWRGGYIVGIAIGAPDGSRWYLPFKHAEGAQFDERDIIAWAKVELCRPGQPKVLANAIYDLTWLASVGVDVTGPFYDVQIAEALLDENRGTYKLDALAMQYLGEGKDETLMEEACAARGFRGAPQEHLWKLPPELVAPYAEADVDRTIRVWAKQRGRLVEEGMKDLFDLETSLIPMLLAMRMRGVRIDETRVAQTRDEMQSRLSAASEVLRSIAGRDVPIWESDAIGVIADERGLPFPRTAKTNLPSFQRSWLERQDDPFCKALVECRKLDKFLTTFIDGSILGTIASGRIHSSFHQLRGDDFGAVTGRFSSSHPNLQFIPKRDSELGPLIRSFFVPDEGELWGGADYSSVEIRILAHYALGPGSDAIRAAFVANPMIDYHQWCADVAKVDRMKAKQLNFGLMYGMGVAKLGRQLGLEPDAAKRFVRDYHAALPFLKATMKKASSVAETRGYVRTICGRRRRFIEWEPSDWNLSQDFRSISEVDRKSRAAVAQWVIEEISKRAAADEPIPRKGTRRAWTYKALNAVIQGSAADLLKKAMADLWSSGACGVLGPPLLTVHDEIAFSVPDTGEGREAFDSAVRLMETALAFKVPIVAEAKLTPTWGG